MKPLKRALVLSGGGARAAYQVGVLEALAEILPESYGNPFPIICGTSAGAINAIYMAAHDGNFHESVASLSKLWRELEIGQIFNHGWWDITKGIGHIGASLFNEGVGHSRPLALLDNAPLWTFLGNTINFDNIQNNIDSGKLHAVGISATGYTSGYSVSFFQGQETLKEWARFRRSGVKTQLRLEHLVASCSIPTIFPAVRIDREYYGDGALRQLAPISPALHLGMDGAFVVGVSADLMTVKPDKKMPPRHSPSMGQIVSHLFNSAFVDALDSDIEHLERMNLLLNLIPEETRKSAELLLRPVDPLVIVPGDSIDAIAGRNVRYLPNSMRFFLRAVGATASGGGATAASYLLFTQEFIGELIALGKQDTLAKRDQIELFFRVKK